MKKRARQGFFSALTQSEAPAPREHDSFASIASAGIARIFPARPRTGSRVTCERVGVCGSSTARADRLPLAHDVHMQKTPDARSIGGFKTL